MRILLLEDEEYTRRFLRKIISEHPLVEEIFDTDLPREAVKWAVDNKPDLIILDIELAPTETLNGIDVAKAIYNLQPTAYFVFLTGYPQYAIESFYVHPYDYILKPISKEKVLELISDIVNKHQEPRKNDRLVIKGKDKTLFIRPSEILFIEKSDKCTIIHSAESSFETTNNLNEFENMLGENFLRVHKSYIVNLDNIQTIQDTGNRSFDVHFIGSDKTAYLSRSKFMEHKDKFIPPKNKTSKS